jgi:hypothetical protein
LKIRSLPVMAPTSVPALSAGSADGGMMRRWKYCCQ